MRAVKDGLPAPSGESEEAEDPRWARAMGYHQPALKGEDRPRVGTSHMCAVLVTSDSLYDLVMFMSATLEPQVMR